MKNTLSFLYQRIKKAELTKEQAESKVCQEIFISKLGNDKQLSSKVAFKGGIILDSLSKGQRGFTKDIDIDFIKYPLSEDGIFVFINQISQNEPYSNIVITVKNIDDLRHKNYLG